MLEGFAVKIDKGKPYSLTPKGKRNKHFDYVHGPTTSHLLSLT